MILLSFMAACSIDRVADIEELVGDPELGAAVYQAECGGCHGPEGEGLSGPAMADVTPLHTDSEFISIVLFGVGDTMPAHEYMSDQEIADVLAWSRQEFGEFSL